MSLMTPNTSSSIHCHIFAATTVGIAQGTSITARMAPRPLKLELTTSAMISPSTNSKETVIRVNLIVSQTASRKIVSCQSSR
jgi:predicted component of type VI protein secretion system